MDIMDLVKAIMRLGMQYERANQIRDLDAMNRIERDLHIVEVSHPDIWITPIVVRGRNIVRRRLGLETVNV